MTWPVASLDTEDMEHAEPAPGFEFRFFPLGLIIGSQEIGATVYELEPGMRVCPYHAHFGNEEMLIVLRGAPALRTEEGEQELRAGDVAAFPRGRAGAHQVINRSTEPVRYVMLSTLVAPDVSLFPDTGKVAVVTDVPPGRRGERTIAAFFRGDAHAGWAEGEPTD